MLDPPLQGFARQGERLEPLATRQGGALYSPLLGAELRQVGASLRVIDPQTGEPLLTAMEVQEQWADTREQLAGAREQLNHEKRARLAAEEALQAALARLAAIEPPS